MEYLVPRRTPDGRLAFVAQSRKSDPSPGDECGYPTIFRVENRVATPTESGEQQIAKGIHDSLLKVVSSLRDQ